MPKPLSGADAPPSSTATSSSGSYPKGMAGRSEPETFFTRALQHLLGARLLTLQELFQAVPLDRLVQAFSQTADTSSKETDLLDPRRRQYVSPISGHLGLSARRYSFPAMVQFLQQHLLGAGLDAELFLKAFPLASWIGHIPLECAWTILAQAPVWETEPSTGTRRIGQEISGTATTDIARAHAVVLLACAVSSGFVAREGLPGIDPEADALGVAASLVDRLGTGQILAEILSPAAETHGIMNAHSAWRREADTTPQDPPSLSLVRGTKAG